MSFTDAQNNALAAPLDVSAVRQRQQAGQRLDYVEAWHVIAEANRIFGFDGWTRETLEMREVRKAEQVGDKWRVGFVCRVRVTACFAVFRDGTGYGSGIAKDLGDAYESAVKEAESDAMKRALMTFGNPFGLALYDKSRANVVDVEAQQSRELNERIMGDLVRQIDQCADLEALNYLAKTDNFSLAVADLDKRDADAIRRHWASRKRVMETGERSAA